MTTKLQDGVYLAHLVGAEVKLSSKGLPMLALQWKLDEYDLTLKSFVHFTLADGSPNVKGIGLVRKWAPDWDGKDLYWFSENLDLAGTYAVRLTVANEPAWNDPTQVYAKVKWVNPADWSGTANPQPGDEDARVGLVPDVDLEPTMQDTWRLWCAMTNRCTASFRDKTWLWFVHETDALKDQIDFTPDDWRRMQEHIKITRNFNH